MTTIRKNELCICIAHTEPQVQKDNLIKAIAASIRWRASYEEVYNNDDFNLMILSQLLEELSTSE